MPPAGCPPPSPPHELHPGHHGAHTVRWMGDDPMSLFPIHSNCSACGWEGCRCAQSVTTTAAEPPAETPPSESGRKVAVSVDVGPAAGGPRSPCPDDSVEELCQGLSARGLAVDRALCVSAAQLFAHTSPQESASKTATAAPADTNASATRNGNHGNDGFCLWFPSVPVASSCPSGFLLSQRLPPVPEAPPCPSGFPLSLWLPLVPVASPSP